MLTARTAEIGDSWQQASSGLYLPPQQRPMRTSKPTAIDLFAGCGGFSLGFKMAGIAVVAAVEFDRDAAATYLVNLGSPDTVLYDDEHPDGVQVSEGFRNISSPHLDPGQCPAGTGWIAGDCSTPGYSGSPSTDDACRCARCCDAEPCIALWKRDVREITGQQILDSVGMAVGEVDVVMGGPPCQGYSISGKRDVMDPRNSLVFEFARLVLEIRPKTFVMENVTGILTMVTPEGVPVLDAMARIMADGGFSSYDALRKGLRSMAGGGIGAVRDGQSVRKRDREPIADVDEPQLDLFDGATP